MAQPIQVYPHLFGIEGTDHSHNPTTHKPLHPTTEELSSRSLTMDAFTATFTSSISKTETTPVNEERAARWSGIGPGMCVVANKPPVNEERAARWSGIGPGMCVIA